MLFGKAWSYVQEIYRQFKEAGYRVKHWLCKGEQMGVPQTRHRVFFIAVRNDIAFDLEKLDMTFNYEPILFKEIKKGNGRKPSEKALLLLNNTNPEDTLLSDAYYRVFGKRSWFTHTLCRDNYVMPTVVAGHGCMWRMEDKQGCADSDYINGQTFPQDYDFGNQNVSYICGMSVPPIMIKRVVARLIDSGLFN